VRRLTESPIERYIRNRAFAETWVSQAVCRAGSKVTEVLAQYAGLSHRPSMTNSGDFTTYHFIEIASAER